MQSTDTKLRDALIGCDRKMLREEVEANVHKLHAALETVGDIETIKHLQGQIKVYKKILTCIA